MSRTYRINEIFYSLQGEGRNAGQAAVFVRFSGCNLTCNVAEHGFDCDTEFTSGVDRTAAEVRQIVDELSGRADPWIIFTGGEPLLQLDSELLDAVDGYRTALETNGTQEPNPGVYERITWIVCSPKTADHTLRLKHADELKYVRNVGQGIPKPPAAIQRRGGGKPALYLSPAATAQGVDPEAARHCIELIKENTAWTLSLQTHKLLAIR